MDSTENQTLKHMLGMRYVDDCFSTGDSPAFVVKSNDDVFIETFHLFKFVSAIYGSNPSRSLVCDVIPRGMGASSQDQGLKDVLEQQDHDSYRSGAD